MKVRKDKESTNSCQSLSNSSHRSKKSKKESNKRLFLNGRMKKIRVKRKIISELEFARVKVTIFSSKAMESVNQYLKNVHVFLSMRLMKS